LAIADETLLLLILVVTVEEEHRDSLFPFPSPIHEEVVRANARSEPNLGLVMKTRNEGCTFFKK
jgi:hypothetical protein